MTDSVSRNFNQDFDRYDQMRRNYAKRVQELDSWLGEQDLLSDVVQDRLQRLQEHLQREKIMVAFVAEFSRGKSELINAIFFAGYGKRIMPASAGRTTMCPTELGWDAAVPPCLRLLPIDTRLQTTALNEWRNAPETWTRINLDVNDGDQLAQAFEKVSEVNRVSVEHARALGFWHDESPEDNPPMQSDGTVEVPRWRHALINIAHPLLKQGLVILDTPGLNAIGAEPELTVSLIPRADAVVFILSADAGVTKSDLTIWREHLVADGQNSAAHLVVLNKIDSMWDALSKPEDIHNAIIKQCTTTAKTLGISAQQVIPVSAQKGLLGKVSGNEQLLNASQLLKLEKHLSETMIGQRHEVLRKNMTASMMSLREDVGQSLSMRDRDVSEQLLELGSLRGKNGSVVRHMHSRIIKEQKEFSSSSARIHGFKTVHTKMLQEIFQLLGASNIKNELMQLSEKLKQSGFKFGIRKIYGETFENLDAVFDQVQRINADVENLLEQSFQQMNIEFGFSLHIPAAPKLQGHRKELAAIQESHLRYLGVSNTLQLTRNEFTDRLVKALNTRIRAVFDAVLADIEAWNKSLISQLDTQVRDRRRSFTKRSEAVERIQDAAGQLEDNIEELEKHQALLQQSKDALITLTNPLMTAEKS